MKKILLIIVTTILFLVACSSSTTPLPNPSTSDKEAELEAKIVELERTIADLSEALANMPSPSPSISDKESELEAKISELEARITELSEASTDKPQTPTPTRTEVTSPQDSIEIPTLTSTPASSIEPSPTTESLIYQISSTTPSVIESRIDGAFEGWNGDSVYRLLNGQVWQQVEYRYRYHYRYSPDVIIYRTSSGYKMKVEGCDTIVRVVELTGASPELQISDWIEDINSNEELTLYDGSGHAIAYIAFDKDATIYMWDGTPVAYLHGDNIYSETEVYGFNGNHLGWFSVGIVYDTQGDRVGFTKSTCPYATYAEFAKYAKYAKPAKMAREAPHSKPTFTVTLSNIPLKGFLLCGEQ